MEYRKNSEQLKTERTEKIKALTDKLENGVKSVFTSEKYENYLVSMSKFYNYSPRNTALIYLQNPEASRVAGFGDWRKKFGRNVKKGEKGLQILAPAPFKVWVDKLDIYGDPIIGKNGNPEKEQQERIAFKIAIVFDVSQTYGKELPTIADRLTANVDGFEKFRNALIKTSPVPVEFAEIPGRANGYFSRGENKIVVRDNLSQAQTLKTLVHEIAHANLHSSAEEAGKFEKNVKEIQAESVAFVVCSHLGIDTSDYSFEYVAGWSKDKNAAELQTQLDVIQGAAAKIIGQIEAELGEKDIEKKVDNKEEINRNAAQAEKAANPGAIDYIKITAEQFERVKPELKALRDGGLKLQVAKNSKNPADKNIIFPAGERDKVEAVIEEKTRQQRENPPLNYTEPFVVFGHCESPIFSTGEQITFAEADEKIKNAVQTERGGLLQGNIFYRKNESATELSSHKFMCYLSDKQSLYENIFNYLNLDVMRREAGEQNVYSTEQAAEVREMLEILEGGKANEQPEISAEVREAETLEIGEHSQSAEVADGVKESAPEKIEKLGEQLKSLEAEFTGWTKSPDSRPRSGIMKEIEDVQSLIDELTEEKDGRQYAAPEKDTGASREDTVLPANVTLAAERDGKTVIIAETKTVGYEEFSGGGKPPVQKDEERFPMSGFSIEDFGINEDYRPCGKNAAVIEQDTDEKDYVEKE